MSVAQCIQGDGSGAYYTEANTTKAVCGCGADGRGSLVACPVVGFAVHYDDVMVGFLCSVASFSGV